MTDATLIFNSKAGGSTQASPDLLVEALYRQGYRPVYRATDDEVDLTAALQDVRGAVFVAGGDGTVRAVALHLVGRRDVRLGIIPLGTANTIGWTLGIEGELLDVLASYVGGQAVSLDPGRITAPWGEDLFLEACGCGAFADVLAEYDPEEGKSPQRALEALRAALGHFSPQPLALTLDGQAQPEMACLLVEVIRVNAEGRGDLLAYVAALARDNFEELASVQNGAVRRAEIPYTGQAFHVDGEVRPAQPGGSGVVQMEAWAGALSVLVPGRQER